MNDVLDPDRVTGIFGGSFDPVHLGHVRIAEELIRLDKVERVLFIPAFQAPHKLDQVPTSPEHRLRMLRLAIGDDPRMGISDHEIRKGGVSYSIHTIEHFLGIFGDRLRIIVGMDSLRDLKKWHRSGELVRLCPILTYRRSGFPDVRLEQLAQDFGEEIARELIANVVHTELFDESSTEIRRRCRSWESLDGLLVPDVQRYIIDNKLYTG